MRDFLVSLASFQSQDNDVLFATEGDGKQVLVLPCLVGGALLSRLHGMW